MQASAVVHVIDDDAAARDSLSFLLESSGFKVETYASVEDFLARGSPAAHGCVITDVCMRGATGLDLLTIMKRESIHLPVIVISGRGNIRMAVEAIRMGALDFIEKPFFEDDIVAAVTLALERNVRAAPAQDGSRAEIVRRMSLLSGRERDVLKGLLAGQPNKIIAHRLGISPRTVEIHRANLMNKMQADTLSSLVTMAILAKGHLDAEDL
ncbi:DNA-binding response regulator [Agaricicola taiwanensis]|uniref:DNA-binding response regulator n=1 Tax=Agaricicola taiwanensis TaxID=591372 RepID=A0A8J2VLG2_9RHOB|nr:response regulator [Agaricicola taiwanensis]GGE30476.1 DNA-binding response regulator [Agaricicola taiwanensis]